jgi:hypothetical protein
MAAKIKLRNVMLGFPALGEPQSLGDSEPAYGAKLPIVPGSENHKAILAAIEEVAREEWKDKAEAVLGMLKEDQKLCLVEKQYRSKKSGEVYEGFENSHYLSTRNAKTQPSVFTNTGVELTSPREIDKQAYSGAIAKAVSVEIWAQDNQWGRRVNCTLLGLVLSGEGRALSGGSAPASSDEFADEFDDASDLV